MHAQKKANTVEKLIDENVLDHIKNGWIAAIISGVVTLGVTVFAMLSQEGHIQQIWDAWSLIDVALVFALAYGISRKSRVAATIMFVYFLLAKIFIMMQSGQAQGIVVGTIFLYFYFRAMVATYQYHRLTAAGAEESSTVDQHNNSGAENPVTQSYGG